MMMQSSLATNYSSLDALVEVVQAYAVAEEYAIVKLRSKAKYKFNIVAKVDIICERDDESRRKLRVKQKKIASIKCDCSFKINVLYKQGLKV